MSEETPRLPKLEYFKLRLAQAEARGDKRKAKYYEGRISEMTEQKSRSLTKKEAEDLFLRAIAAMNQHLNLQKVLMVPLSDDLKQCASALHELKDYFTPRTDKL